MQRSILSTAFTTMLTLFSTTIAAVPIQSPTSNSDAHVFYVLPLGLSSTVNFYPVTPTVTSSIPTFTLDCTDLKVISAITTKTVTVIVTSTIIKTKTQEIPYTTSTIETPLPPVRPHCPTSCTVSPIPTTNPDQNPEEEELTLGLIQENLESTLLQVAEQFSAVYEVTLGSAWEFVSTVLRKAEKVVETKILADLEADLDKKLTMKRREELFLTDIHDDANELKRVFS